MPSYFSAETSLGTRAFYALLCLITLLYTLVGLLSPLITPKCDIPLLLKDPFRRQLVQVWSCSVALKPARPASARSGAQSGASGCPLARGRREAGV